MSSETNKTAPAADAIEHTKAVANSPACTMDAERRKQIEKSLKRKLDLRFLWFVLVSSCQTSQCHCPATAGSEYGRIF